MPCSRSSGECAIPACLAAGLQGALLTGVSAPRRCLLQGGVCSQGVPVPGASGGDPPSGTATATGSTDPTGMHSCSICRPVLSLEEYVPTMQIFVYPQLLLNQNDTAINLYS